MTSGYQALHESCAWYDLSTRGKIFARGEDRKRLLHAMTTNHVQELSEGEGLYAFFLTAQGRILGDVNLLNLPDAVLLDTEPEATNALYQHLDRYIIADDVTLEDATDQLATIEVGGPTAATVLRQAGASLSNEEGGFTIWDTEIVARMSATGANSYRIITPIAEKEELILTLESGGAVRADAESWNIVRLENGHPRFGVDFSENNLPQETQISQALHFQKGCYLGQEIVERVRSRGHVNKILVPLAIDATAAPAQGAKVVADEKEVGEIRSSAYSPALQQVVALAFLRAEHARDGAVLSVDGQRAKLRSLAQRVQ